MMSLHNLPISKSDLNFFKELKEFTLYEVEVSMTKNNPIHKAFLFNGFNTGGYTVVYNNDYEYPVPLREIYYLKVIKELADCK